MGKNIGPARDVNIEPIKGVKIGQTGAVNIEATREIIIGP